MIITAPNQVLITPTRKVGKIDKKVLQIINKMKDVLTNTNNPKGVGLAAPQIGIPLCIFITRPKEKGPIDVFINPQISWYSKEVSEIQRVDEGANKTAKEKKLEGCLSIPGVWGYLKRPTRVRLKYINTNGISEEKEFSGFTATIVQHETDHLNGILYTHRVLSQKQKLYRIETGEKGEENLVEIKI